MKQVVVNISYSKQFLGNAFEGVEPSEKENDEDWSWRDIASVDTNNDDEVRNVMRLLAKPLYDSYADDTQSIIRDTLKWIITSGDDQEENSIIYRAYHRGDHCNSLEEPRDLKRFFELLWEVLTEGEDCTKDPEVLFVEENNVNIHRKGAI